MTAKERLLRIVADARGDDLERAQAAFKGMTPDQLDQEYGLSRRTRREILAECTRRRREWEAAYELAKGCPNDLFNVL